MFRMASFAATFFKDRDDYVAYTRFTKRSVLFEYVYSAEVSAHPKCCIIYSYHSRHIKKTKYIKISFSSFTNFGFAYGPSTRTSVFGKLILFVVI